MAPTLVNVEQHNSLPASALNAAVTVPAEAPWVRTVRHFTSVVLSRWAVSGDDLDTSLLIVSELAGNSVLHGRADLAVLLSLQDHVLSITVMDSGAATEHASAPTPSAGHEHGRGLDIVAALADRCETHPKPSGWRTRICMRIATVP